MKILHLLDIHWWSGLTSYAFDTIQAHQTLGNQVTLAISKDSIAYKKSNNLNCSILPIKGRKGFEPLLNFFVIGREIFKNKPDWIISHTGSTHWIALALSLLFKIPLIRVRAISQKLKTHWINKMIYQKSSYIVTASENLRFECLNLVASNYKNKIRTILPKVGEEFIAVKVPQPNPANEQNPRSETASEIKDQFHNPMKVLGNKKIGMVARLDPVKGLFNFLKVAKIVQESCPEAEFQIAGPEENITWHSLLNQAKTLGLKNLTYHGFLDSKSLVKFMNQCSMGLITSTGSEEVSRVLIEWMSLGKTVISTNVGSLPEILKEGRGGYLVQPNEPLKMAEKIIQLFQNQNLLDEMGQFNWDLCKNKFSQERFCHEWKNLLG